jgi:excinuclease ABC subunit B
MGSGRTQSRGRRASAGTVVADALTAAGGRRDNLPARELAELIQELTDQMHQAATDLHFELAARLRDEISDLKKELRQMRAATD